MAGSINKVILVGHLGKDPETKSLPSGVTVANFSLATSESWKDKSGAKQEKTEWHNIVVFDKLADVAGKWLKKGQLVFIEGQLTTRSWEDKESGQKRYMTEIKAREIQMLGGGKGSSAPETPKSGEDVEKGAPDDDVPF